jgi:cell division transport system ATP-binding protein
MLIDYSKVTIYQQDTCVLKDVDFHVDEGEFIYIIGKVGVWQKFIIENNLLRA